VYKDNKIDLCKWEKISVAEAFKKYAYITNAELFDHKKFAQRSKENGYITTNIQENQTEDLTYEELWSQMYTNEVEPLLGKSKFPTLIYDYPIEFASLSKPNADGKTAQRFEFYIAGIEIGNCYGELTDWKLQENRLQLEQQERKKSGKIDHRPDLGFLDALKIGMPECAGIAIGVERLAMIFADVDSIDKLKLVSIE